jgi:hypothetical protein
LVEKCSSLVRLPRTSGRSPENILEEISSFHKVREVTKSISQRPTDAIILQIQFSEILQLEDALGLTP